MTKIIGKPTLDSAKKSAIQLLGTGVGVTGYEYARKQFAATKEIDAAVALGSIGVLASIKGSGTSSAIVTALVLGIGVSATLNAAKSYATAYAPDMVKKYLGVNGLGLNQSFIEDLNQSPNNYSLPDSLEPVDLSGAVYNSDLMI